ncbi:hypothetical protein VAWG006_10600 [Aeromonas enteropelogenes]|uniref:Uncharacterized protein n=1 Tax=Aeromonas sp. 19NY04SH05-1 TaxID=2920537 RepID=A0AAU6TCB8_9GAMM|nr:hypothetical protein VAWG006_10600 [Aeromonas enteropelogenes]BEE20970.1 hypothetical protein VAWG007_10650 [Aeromonas enteropelogenes]
MGLHVHSLNNIPKSENRDYLVYLLEYGWHEPLAEALDKNFLQMAGVAAKNRAVVIKGTELAHFENEVFSWHQINNQRGEDVLPAILITNAHPSYFMDNNQGYKRHSGLYRESVNGDLKLILIPLKKFCSNTSDVVSLIERLFSDIEGGKDLSEFKIAKEVQKGIGSAIVDALILEPNISGVGFSFKKLTSYFGKDG